MERTALLHTDYLDILFHNRNKIYGGYELRKHYPDRVRKALFTVVFFVSALGGFQLYTTLHKHQTFMQPVLPPPTILTPLDNIYTPPPPPPPPQAAMPANFAPTVANPPVTVVPDHTVIDNPPKTSDDLKGKGIGANDNAGNGGTQTDFGGTPGNGTGDGLQPGTGTEPSVATAAPPVRWVDQMPRFEGNMEDYLHNNLRYPEMARESNIEGRVAVEFLVDEEGNISNVKLVKGIGGGCDDEAVRVVKNMPRWQPGKQNGRPVKVLMTLPIMFTLN